MSVQMVSRDHLSVSRDASSLVTCMPGSAADALVAFSPSFASCVSWSNFGHWVHSYTTQEQGLALSRAGS